MGSCLRLLLLTLVLIVHGAPSSTSLRKVARSHADRLDLLLYPPLDGPGATLKERRHSVKEHPIYNFLHTYYRYSAEELRLYSPGFGETVQIDDDGETDLLLHPRFRRRLADDSNSVTYDLQQQGGLEAEGRYGWIQLSRARDLLQATSDRAPNFGCFGLHEWAMLYREHPKHQQRALRVSPKTIDSVVEAEGSLKCTHYDAFRFFEPMAQGLNSVHLSRAVQAEHEQPACIHASMDLFKYAFRLYPLCSGDLLARTLEAALRARIIDMRASPYDVSAFEGCEEPICVETQEGRKLYVQEQTELMRLAAPLRLELLAAYNRVLSSV